MEENTLPPIASTRTPSAARTPWRMFMHALCGTTVLLSTTGCILTDPEDRVAYYIEKEKEQKALSWLNEKLSDNPSDPLLHALAIEVTLNICTKTKCHKKNPSLLAPLAGHFKYIKGPVKTEAATHDPAQKLVEATQSFISDEVPAALTLQLAEAFPQNMATDAMFNVLLEAAAQKSRLENQDEALSLLEKAQGISPRILKNKEAAQAILHVITAQQRSDTASLANAIAALKALPEKTKLSQEEADAFVASLYSDAATQAPATGTDLFLSVFPQLTTRYEVPWLLREENRSILAKALANTTKQEAFLNKALTHTQNPLLRPTEKPKKASTAASAKAAQTASATEGASQTTTSLGAQGISETTAVTPSKPLKPTEENKQGLRLRLLKAALAVQPQSSAVFNAYLRPAAAHVARTQDIDVLLDGSSVRIIQMKPGDITGYNQQVFALMEKGLIRKKDITPLARKLLFIEGTPTQPACPQGDCESTKAQQFIDEQTASKERLGKTLSQALENAIEIKDMEAISNIAQLDPTLAGNARQRIVALVLSEIDAKWERNSFDGMNAMADFLRQQMNIGFDYDGFLLERFDAYLKERNIPINYSSNAPDVLTQNAAALKADFGDKFAFLKEHFKDKPDTLNTRLKSLVLGAQGIYGQAIALCALNDLFDDSTFPAETRAEYLNTALKRALLKDPSLTPVTFVDAAYKIAEQHPQLPLSFITEQTLKKVTNIEDAIAIWAQAADPLKEAFSITSPQFAVLMKGLEAHKSGDKQEATRLLTTITDSKLIHLAAPYLKEYLAGIRNLEGIYLRTEAGNSLGTLLVYVTHTGSDAPPPSATSADGTTNEEETNLLSMKLSFLSALGHTSIESPETFMNDNGNIFRASLNAPIYSNTMTITLPDEQKDKVRSKLPFSFNQLFGNIQTVQFGKNTLTLKVSSEKKEKTKAYTFKKIAADPTLLLAPNGKYTVLRTLSAQNDETAAMLPPQSVITFNTNTKVLSKIVENNQTIGQGYPVSGKITFPKAKTTIPFTGYYNKNLQFVSFAYMHPIGVKQTLKATMRCQIADTLLLCAGHNLTWGRDRFGYQVIGTGKTTGLNTKTPRPFSAGSSMPFAGTPAAPAAASTSETDSPATASGTTSPKDDNILFVFKEASTTGTSSTQTTKTMPQAANSAPQTGFATTTALKEAVATAAAALEARPAPTSQGTTTGSTGGSHAEVLLPPPSVLKK